MFTEHKLSFMLDARMGFGTRLQKEKERVSSGQTSDIGSNAPGAPASARGGKWLDWGEMEAAEGCHPCAGSELNRRVNCCLYRVLFCGVSSRSIPAATAIPP